MSKAFIKESDNDDETPDDDRESNSLPNGKNYITPTGYKKLTTELQQLKFKERPEITKIIEWAAGNGDRSENGDYLYGKKKLREIDKRIRFLNKRIEAAEIIDPLKRVGETEKVYFGATVTILDEEDNKKVYSIVGVDEVDVLSKRISWLSPIGAALLKGSKGGIVTFASPKGQRDIEIIEVEYKEIY